MSFASDLQEVCAGMSEEGKAELLAFTRLYVRVPEFRDELHVLTEAAGEELALREVEALMAKYEGRIAV